MIDRAIKKINSDAKFIIRGDNIDSCKIEWIDTTPISKADIKAQLSTVENEIAQEETNLVNAVSSGKQKLIDLGLTEEEIKALIGV